MYVKKEILIKWYAMIVFILGTGSLYFQVLRMPMMAAMLILAGLLLFLLNGMKKYNLQIYAAITLLLLFDSLLTIHNGFRINDFVIWIVNIFIVMMIQSNFSFREFCGLYVKVMVIEAAVSLICFFVGDVIGVSLPFLHYESNVANGYYLTPYYTLGWANIPVFGRNAGIFHEPGMHQIFLNMALLYLLSGDFEVYRKRKYFILATIILIATILTTQSTTGYMCLAVVLCTVAFRKSGGVQTNKIKILAIIAIIVLIIVETQTSVIETKLEGRTTYQGSYHTRANDTLSGFLIALQSPIVGRGVFCESLSNLLKSYGIVNISNGLVSFVIKAGVVIAVVWVLVMFYKLSKAHDLGIRSNILICIFYLLCINSEGIFMNILFLTYLAPFKPELELVGGGVILCSIVLALHQSEYVRLRRRLKEKLDSSNRYQVAFSYGRCAV